VHEPLRLNVLIAAPAEAIEAILTKHAQVRELVDNGWVHLFRLTGIEPRFERYTRVGAWTPIDAAGPTSA
jgi:uncharacterized protein YbcC (UPF0753/DUF2309 family)